MPTIPFRKSTAKRSNLSQDEKVDLIIKAISKSWWAFSDNKISLERTAENGLGVCSRDEVLEVLKWLQNSGSIFKVGKENDPKIDYIYSKHGDGERHVSEVGESVPLTFEILPRYENWYAAYKLKKETGLKDLSGSNLNRLHHAVFDIAEILQMSHSERITLHSYPAGEWRDWGSRNLAVDFMQNKGILSVLDRKIFETGKGYFSLQLKINHFLKFKDELRDFLKKDKSEKKESKLPENLRWEEIAIKFQDEEKIRIKTKDRAFGVTFREMGFEDGRNGKPNQQWELLKLFASKGGELDWDKPEAKDNLKKKKQLLAETLQEFFQIKEDPFFPYEIEGKYKLKFHVSISQ